FYLHWTEHPDFPNKLPAYFCNSGVLFHLSPPGEYNAQSLLYVFCFLYQSGSCNTRTDTPVPPSGCPSLYPSPPPAYLHKLHILSDGTLTVLLALSLFLSLSSGK